MLVDVSTKYSTAGSTQHTTHSNTTQTQTVLHLVAYVLGQEDRIVADTFEEHDFIYEIGL